MADLPPPSLLITPDRRRRLTQIFAEARTLAAQPRPPVRQIHELLAECVRNDPGNVLYFDALLANLRCRKAVALATWRAWSWLAGWWRKKRINPQLAGGDNSSVLSTRYSVLANSPNALWDGVDDPRLFCQLAAAAGDCEFDEVELRLLTEARRLAPDNAETLRQAARALTRQGRFEEAVGPWHAVAALLGGDTEAEQAIADLRFAAPVIDEAALADSKAARGADLGLAAQWQELRLSQSLERVEIARRRAEHDPHPRAQSLVTRLEDDHRRLQIEMLSLRAEQYPADASVRVELGKCLRHAGNYSGAVSVLEEALKLEPGLAGALIELGECRQHLRQFEQALECYQRAIGATVGEGLEESLLARYRAGVLAAAMGQTDFARGQFEAILAVRAGYRDVEGRLRAILELEKTSTRSSGRSGPDRPT